jgi:hypothetical protein
MIMLTCAGVTAERPDASLFSYGTLTGCAVIRSFTRLPLQRTSGQVKYLQAYKQGQQKTYVRRTHRQEDNPER